MMATITVKNIPDDLYHTLKQSAGANHRSINSEVIVCVERALGHRNVDVEGILASARQIRESIRCRPLSDAEFTKAKKRGRP